MGGTIPHPGFGAEQKGKVGIASPSLHAGELGPASARCVMLCGRPGEACSFLNGDGGGVDGGGGGREGRVGGQRMEGEEGDKLWLGYIINK